MKEPQPKIFNFALLRLVSAKEFLGILKSGFIFWLLFYGFCVLVTFGFGWLISFTGDAVGIKPNKWVDPVFHRTVSFWIIVAIFVWMIIGTGIKSLLKDFGELFINLSKLCTKEIVISIVLCVIIPSVAFFSYFSSRSPRASSIKSLKGLSKSMASFLTSFWRSFSMLVDTGFLAMNPIYRIFFLISIKKDLQLP